MTENKNNTKISLKALSLYSALILMLIGVIYFGFYMEARVDARITNAPCVTDLQKDVAVLKNKNEETERRFGEILKELEKINIKLDKMK
jgi:hypothetical protein